ncbi:RxLR effector protein, partial [Phytophthora megakarya]
FAVIIAATLHVSGAVVHATKDSKVMIDNVAAPAIEGAPHANAGRQLRRVDKNAEKEAALEEERMGTSVVGKFIQNKAAQFMKSSAGQWLNKKSALRKAAREKKLNEWNAIRRQNIHLSGGTAK